MYAKYEKLEEINVVRRGSNLIDVLGKNVKGHYLHHIIISSNTFRLLDEVSFKQNDGMLLGLSSLFSFMIVPLPVTIPIICYQLRRSALENRRKTKEYYANVKKFQEANLKDLGMLLKI